MHKLATAIDLTAWFSASDVGATGLTVTVDVWRGSTQIVADGPATEIGGGFYGYTVASGSVTVAGPYRYVFSTAGTADDPELPGMVWIGTGGVENLDDAVSTRLATAAYTAPANADLTTLLARLTSTRAGLLDNLDAAISSRLAATSYTAPTAPDNAGIATLVARLTAARATLLDNLAQLDAAISSRLSTTGYTAPANADITAIKAKTDLIPATAIATEAKQDAAKTVLDTVAADYQKRGVAVTLPTTAPDGYGASIDSVEATLSAATQAQIDAIEIDTTALRDRLDEQVPGESPVIVVEAGDDANLCAVYIQLVTIKGSPAKGVRVDMELVADSGAVLGGGLISGPRSIPFYSDTTGLASVQVKRNDLLDTSGTSYRFRVPSAQVNAWVSFEADAATKNLGTLIV